MPKLANIHPNVLASSRALILGGTSGIGAAVSSGVLANEGKVYVSSSNEANISAAVKHLQATYPGTTVSGGVADLSNKETVEANIKAVLDSAIKELDGPLDHIIYTAGDPLKLSNIATADANDLFARWGVRYIGPAMLSKIIAANPDVYLKSAPTSSVIFTGGLLSKRPQRGILASAAGALEVLSRSLAVEIAPIRVNTVVPGAIATELLEKFPHAVVDGYREKALTKTIGKPEAVAEAYLFIMRCSFITGQEIVVDGGATYA